MNRYSFKEITDKTSWNEFLEKIAKSSSKVPPITFIQSWEWLDFQESYKNQTYRLGIFENDKIVGLSAGVVIRAKRGKYLYVRNGPVIDWKNKELTSALFAHLKSWAKSQKLWFVRISPLIEQDSDSERNLNSYNFPKFVMNDVEALDTWIMDIEPSEEELFNSIKKKVRYEIRSAEKQGVEVFTTQDSKYIDDYYDILKDTVQRQNWNAYSKEYIKKEFETFASTGKASIVLMQYQGKFIAGGIFIHFANQSFYHYGASLTEFRNIPSMYLLIWEAIKLAKSHQLKYFNFWGIAPANKPKHPWVGLSNFKMKFPGFEQRWCSSVDIPVSPLYYLTNLYERIDKYRKGY